MSHQTVSEPWFDPQTSRAVILITGIQAAGKSTVAQLLAERLRRSVHVRGDLFRRMVINGRAEMTPGPTDEAVRQLRLRHHLTAMVTDAYFQAGFTVVTQDIIVGDHLAEMTTMIKSRPLFLIVLAPSAVTIAARERPRGKPPYATGPIEQLTPVPRHKTPRLGLGLDPPAQTATESAGEILARAWPEASIRTPPKDSTRTQPPAD